MAAAVFAIIWATIRACAQSVTIDEGDTYFWFVAKSAKELFHPFPNNHILNSLLMWVSIHVFGTSVLSIRAPALLGGVIYIAVCYFLSRSIADRFIVQLSIFICLVYNPFILDFMSVARGYSLANAFLLAAIAAPVRQHQTGGSVRRYSTLASLALGISFTAVFSYAFVDIAVFVAIATWAVRRRGAEPLMGVLGCCILPGLVVAVLVGAYPIAHWPKGELFYGAHSLEETMQSLVNVSLYRLNPRLAALDSLKGFLLPVLGVLCVWRVAIAELDRSLHRDARARWLGTLGLGLAAMVALTVLLHWLAFRFDGLPLPLTRTGMFFVPLCTLMVATVVALPARSFVSELLRRATAALFFCLACYFLLCLRMSYFEEYQDNADMKEIYGELARLNHTYGVADVVVHSMYVAPLNFYRMLSKKETFPEFLYVPDQHLPEGKSIYVLHRAFFKEYIEREKLVIIYRGGTTDAVVAVRSGGLTPAVGGRP